MLIFVCENYNNSLKGNTQSVDLLSEDDSDSKSLKKRKESPYEMSSSCGTDIGGGGAGAGCCKRTREIIKTSNVSKVYSKTPPSDTTLVSSTANKI